MKNILRIFKYDLKKIHKNVIAMIVIMGITVIPTLYACSISLQAGIHTEIQET